MDDTLSKQKVPYHTDNILPRVLEREMRRARLVEGHIRNSRFLNRVLDLDVATFDLLPEHTRHNSDADQTGGDSQHESNNLIASAVLLLGELGCSHLHQPNSTLTWGRWSLD